MRAKGQSQIIQFMLFFMIGLAIFIIVGNVFKDRLDFYTADVADANRKLINTHFSALVVQAMVSCKECDAFNSTTKIANYTAGYATELGLNSQYLTVLHQPGGLQFQTQAHNMLLALAGAGGSAFSTQPIILSYSKNQNILRVLS